jgi:MtN3 and saliva related transmembrane protein
MIATILGVLAASVSVASFLPQAWRVIRTRQTGELATMMWVLNVVGFGLWGLYGITLGAWAIVIPNAICWLFSGFILAMKLVSSRTRHAIADVLDPAIDAGAVRRGEAPAFRPGSQPGPDDDRS